MSKISDSHYGSPEAQNGGLETCPEHGDSLQYHADQGDEYEPQEHLECSVTGCEYEVWAS